MLTQRDRRRWRPFGGELAACVLGGRERSCSNMGVNNEHVWTNCAVTAEKPEN